jgi:hypothetical protein
MVMVANDQSASTGNALQWDESPGRHAMREKLAVRKSGETPAHWFSVLALPVGRGEARHGEAWHGQVRKRRLGAAWTARPGPAWNGPAG